ncbi:MAG TPA: response regulator [Burkholderiales bacterium]|nr:response regulator [Burkholderiales bacterium]
MSRPPEKHQINWSTDARVFSTGHPASRTPKRILVADDNRDTLSFMQAALEDTGYEVKTASGGAQALDLLAVQGTDLLITDVFMPGLDGIETLRECNTRYPHIRVIVMSAGSQSGRKLDYLPAAILIGADATISMPVDVDQLLETVYWVLQR